MWRRIVPFPSIWRKFKGRREIDGVIPTFWIQDIPPEEYENVVQCMVTRFCGDEPLTKYSNFLSDPQSVQEITVLWREVLKDKLGIICYMENPDKSGKPIFVGVNCTHKKLKTDEKHSSIPYTGKAISTIMNLMDHVMKQKSAFEEIKTDVLLSGLGMYVFPQFRGQNIGLELLNAREDLCKKVGIKASVAVFTATTSQILAKRAGYQELYETSYEDLAKQYPEFSLPGISSHSKDIKYSYKVFT